MEYVFILGRNVKLSIAEVISYLDREENKIESYAKYRNSVLIKTKKPLKKRAIDWLGGVIAIGQVIASGNSFEELIRNIENKEIYSGTKTNFNYAIWNFSECYIEISEYLKKRFKSERLKASEKKLSGFIKLQPDRYKTPFQEFALKPSSSMIDEQYFLFKGNKRFYFGKITQQCNYEEIEKRDMEKPVRRAEFAISPRLAKIMINLSLVKPGQTVLDPFCGVGVILQEALLQGMKAIGIDKDKEAINNARKNLNWAGFSEKEYSLINGNSAKIKIQSCNVIVTEPHFGEPLRKIPSEEKAKAILGRFEKLMISVLSNLKKSVSGRIVFTAPFVRTPKSRIGCNIDNILSRTGLKIAPLMGGKIRFPIPEFREKQIVGREIFVLEHQQ